MHKNSLKQQVLTTGMVLVLVALFVSRANIALHPKPELSTERKLAYGYGSSSSVSSPVSEVCGNGLVEGTEACDDGNLISGDGCSMTCTVETGWSCSGQPSSCSEICGDSQIVGSETCDDGNTASGDGCSSSCQLELSNNLCLNSLIAYWKVDEGTGSTALDMTTNSHDGVYTNMTAADWVSTGATSSFRNPYAIDLDGTDDFIDVASNPLDLASDFSIALWFNLNSTNIGAMVQNRGSGTSGTQDGIQLGVFGSQLLFQLEDGGSYDTNQGGTVLSNNTWYHVVATFDRSTGVKTLYLNGVQDYTSTNTGLISADFISGRNTTLGALWDSAATQSQHWTGQLDDIRVYGRVLAQSEANHLYTGGDANAGCITCGDGSVHKTEQCDDGDADDSDGCSSQCLVETGWTCSGIPSTCTAICGDGLVLGAEQCDDGAGNSDTLQDACRTSCMNASCGDGVRDSDEACDDGNTDNTDDCLNICVIPFCGDGYVHSEDEECEPTLNNQCTQTCMISQESGRGGGRRNPRSSSSSSFKPPPPPPPGCGDGELEGDEECDEGKNNGLGDCSRECTRTYCGDGFVNSGEECEPIPLSRKDGTRIFPIPSCGRYCSPPLVDDDGLVLRDTAGRSSGGCQYVKVQECPEEKQNQQEERAVCGDGIVSGDEECDYGGTCDGGRYDDAYWLDEDAAELCRDGGGTTRAISGDGCSDTCKAEFCGDGKVQRRGPDNNPGTGDDEQCDNGSRCSVSGRSCTDDSQCRDGETCDYDLKKDPSCSSLCQVLSCKYTLKLDISDLGEGTHSFRVTVTNVDGASDIDATIFTVGLPLSARAELEVLAKTSVPQSTIFSWLAQLAGKDLKTTLQTDVDHYVKSDDLQALLTCSVYDEFGNPICGLDPNAFVLQLDGADVEQAVFEESSGERCGDGLVQGTEQCDDGNQENGDGCTAACENERSAPPVSKPAPKPKPKPAPPSPPVCGNGKIEAGEICDDGNTLSGDGCSAVCDKEAICGNSIIEDNEQCDDGNILTGDGCNEICRIEEEITETCGNGTLDVGEMCDEGAFNSDTEPNSCRKNCQKASCGDYIIDAGEACDSGTGNTDFLPDHCRKTCQLPSCGDSIVDEGEQCDGGPDCLPNCTRQRKPRCGNGKQEFGEQCDDGNVRPGDGCSNVCIIEPLISGIALCGNGIIDANEQCDDGNRRAGDGCNQLCWREVPAPRQPAVRQTIHNAPLQVPQQPYASLIPVRYDYGPIGDTGPAAIVVTAFGTASGLLWSRRKRSR